MPRLRGHHLICLHFFQGEGYDDGFVRNLTHVLKSAEHSSVDIVHGIDDICMKCPHAKDCSCEYTDHSDDEIREMDDTALDLLDVGKVTRVSWSEIRGKIPGIFRSWYESYCLACGWRRACEKNGSYRKLTQTT